MKRRLIWNTFFNGLGTAWGFGINLLLLPFLIRTLGKEAYGAWVLVMSFSVVSGYLSLLDFGFQTSIVKFVAEHHARKETLALNQILSAALFVFAALGAIAAVGLILFASLFLNAAFNIPPALTNVTRLLLYVLAVQILFEFPGLIFSAVLEGLQRYDLLRLVDMGRTGLYALLLVVLLSQGYGLMAVGIATLIVAVLKVLAMVLLSYRLLPTLHLVWRLGWKVYQHILSFSSQIFILRINAVVYNQMDKAIIGALLISTLLTDYDIANKIQSLVLASLTLTSSLMVPAASQLDAIQDETQLQELFVKGTKYTIALCLPAAIFALVFAEAIIRYWIGPDYVHDAGITRLYLVYLFYLPITVVGYNMMIGMNRIQPLVRTQIATTLVNLAVSVVLVNSVGMAGVIWGTLIGNALTLYPYLRHFLTTLKVPWARFWNESLRPTYSVALLFALLLYAVVRCQAIGSLAELAILGSGGLVVYGGLFFALGLSSAERRALLTAILRNLSWT